MREALSLSLSLVSLIVVLATACSESVITPDEPATGDQSIFSLAGIGDKPGKRLSAVGCVRKEIADTGFVVLGVPGGPSLIFDCSKVGRIEWELAYRTEVQDRTERLAVEGLTAAMTGYWQYQVVEITATCTGWLGAVEYLLPSDANAAVYTPDGQYVGHYDFVGGVPLRFDFYSSYPCSELVLSQGEWWSFRTRPTVRGRVEEAVAAAGVEMMGHRRHLRHRHTPWTICRWIHQNW